ncbi:hypothetical protein QW131_21270 [Roseibium salinum]|nr:hypothetical protein [Roseibium salinum]
MRRHEIEQVLQQFDIFRLLQRRFRVLIEGGVVDGHVVRQFFLMASEM